MFWIEDADAVEVCPQPNQSTTITRRYFQDGDPQEKKLATIVTADWLNMVQDEILNVVDAAGIAPNKQKHTQLLEAIPKLVGGGSYEAVGDTLALRDKKGKSQFSDPEHELDAVNLRTLIRGIRGDVIDIDTGKPVRTRLAGTTLSWTGAVTMAAYTKYIIPFSNVITDTAHIFDSASNAFRADEDMTILLYCLTSYGIVNSTNSGFGLSLGFSVNDGHAGGNTLTHAGVYAGGATSVTSFMLLELNQGDVVKLYTEVSLANVVQAVSSKAVLKIV